MTSISAIYGARKRLGIDDETARDLYERTVGKRSLRLMSPSEQTAVLNELNRSVPKGQKRLPGPYAGKLQALWISGWHLGLVRNNSDEALLAFVKGQTGIDHTRFLQSAADARKAIEALKAWLTRDAGVNWNEFTDPAACVIAAQLRVLGRAPGSISYTVNGQHSEGSEALAKHAAMAVLGTEIRALPKALK